MSYGSSLQDAFHRAGTCTGRFLKGARPSELPIQQSTKVDFVINLRAAKALDVEVPPHIDRRDIRPDDKAPRHKPIIRRTHLPASDFVTGDTSGQTQAVQVVFTILANPPVFGSRDHYRGNRSEALHDFLRFFEASQMGQA